MSGDRTTTARSAPDILKSLESGEMPDFERYTFPTLQEGLKSADHYPFGLQNEYGDAFSDDPADADYQNATDAVVFLTADHRVGMLLTSSALPGSYSLSEVANLNGIYLPGAIERGIAEAERQGAAIRYTRAFAGVYDVEARSATIATGEVLDGASMPPSADLSGFNAALKEELERYVARGASNAAMQVGSSIEIGEAHELEDLSPATLREIKERLVEAGLGRKDARAMANSICEGPLRHWIELGRGDRAGEIAEVAAEFGALHQHAGKNVVISADTVGILDGLTDREPHALKRPAPFAATLRKLLSAEALPRQTLAELVDALVEHDLPRLTARGAQQPASEIAVLAAECQKALLMARSIPLPTF